MSTKIKALVSVARRQENRVSTLIVLAGMVAAGICFYLNTKRGFEFLIYLILFSPILLYGPVKKLFLRLAVWRLTIVVALLASLVLAQMYSKARNTYPWTSWGMYTRGMGVNDEFFEVVATLSNGDKLIFPFRQETYIGVRKLRAQAMRSMTRLRRAYEDGDEAKADLHKGELDQLKELFKKSSPPKDIIRFTLNHYLIDFENFTGRESVIETTVFNYEPQ